MTTTTVLNFDNQSFDLNSLFNITHTYDVLKTIIGSLAKNQVDLSNKLKNVESNNRIKSQKIIQLEVAQVNMKESNEKKFNLVYENLDKIEGALNRIIKDNKKISIALNSTLSSDDKIELFTETLDLPKIKQISDKEDEKIKELLEKHKEDLERTIKDNVIVTKNDPIIIKKTVEKYSNNDTNTNIKQRDSVIENSDERESNIFSTKNINPLSNLVASSSDELITKLIVLFYIKIEKD